MKRLLDAVGAAVLLVVLAPLLAVVAATVAIGLGRPVLFRQRRPGLHGIPFTIVKFRSMREIDDRGRLVDDADRLTAFGAWLRSTSLDELPSLWNILIGEMSFVGPRPSRCEYLPLYTPEQARRHDVRPGLTGLAQVRGRNALPWPERLASDIEYVDTRTLMLDARIFIRTVGVVLRREGITAPGHATSDPFTGTRSVA